MIYRAIGIMSGSSMDGLDIAFTELTETGGKWSYEIIAADCLEYPDEWRGRLLTAVDLSALNYQLLHAEFDLALLGRDAEYLCFDDLARAQHFLGMIDALVGADLAYVDEAFNSFSDLNECAKRHDLGDWAFDLRADGKFAGDI